MELRKKLLLIPAVAGALAVAVTVSAGAGTAPVAQSRMSPSSSEDPPAVARGTVARWVLAQQAMPCATPATCLRTTVFLDQAPLPPEAIETGFLQAWVVSNTDRAPRLLDVTDPTLVRAALASAVFTEEARLASASLLTDPEVVRTAREISAQQSREYAALSAQDRARYKDMTHGVGLTDPRSDRAVAGYTQFVARTRFVTRSFGRADGSYDMTAMRTWLRERLVASHATVTGLDASLADLAAALVMPRPRAQG
jgi:hypothetical protein